MSFTSRYRSTGLRKFLNTGILSTKCIFLTVEIRILIERENEQNEENKKPEENVGICVAIFILSVIVQCGF